MMTNKMKAFQLNDRFIIITNNTGAKILFDKNTNDFYKYQYIDDLPGKIREFIEGKDLMEATKENPDRQVSLDIIPSQVLEKIHLESNKPTLFFTQSSKDKELIDIKKKTEEYYKIKVNADNKKEKYYFNYRTYKYELLDTFQFGVLLENDFQLTLSEKQIKTIFGMFRNVEEPNNNAICFNNIVMDTTTFKQLPKDTFTVKKIHHDYIPIQETKHNTLVEKTLKNVLIPANDSTKTDYYWDFLQRFGASFKRVNKHKFIYMLHGDGDDGKGILFKIMSMVYGDLAVSIKPSNLTDDFFATNLSDTNLILMDELNKESFTDHIVDILKDISGRGVRDVRIMRSQETIKAKDYGVIMIATNNIPNVSFSQVAYWKRLILIHLPNTFDENLKEDTEEKIQDNILRANVDLEFDLAGDTDGIEWLISASIEAYKNKGDNFKVTQSATATQLLSVKSNPINAFIGNFVHDSANKYNWLANIEVKYYFLKWCISNNLTVKDLDVASSNELSKDIGRVIVNKYPKVSGNKVRKGGVTAYPYLYLNIDDEIPSIEEIKENIRSLEDKIFSY